MAPGRAAVAVAGLLLALLPSLSPAASAGSPPRGLRLVAHSGVRGVVRTEPGQDSHEVQVAPEPAHRTGHHETLLAALQYAAAHGEEIASHLGPEQSEALSFALRSASRVSRASRSSQGLATAAANATAAKPANGGSAAGGTISAAFGIEMDRISTLNLVNTAWIIAGCSLVAFIIFEVVHRQWAETDLSKSPEMGKEQHENHLHRMFVGVWPLVRPYLCQTRSRASWFYFGTILVLGVVELGLVLVLMFWKKDFWDIIEQKRLDDFPTVMLVFTLLVFSIIMVRTYLGYISMMLVIHWRRFLTSWMLSRWLENKVFYQLQLDPESLPDNPDQRIQEDVPLFIEAFLSLSGGLLESAGRLCVMLPMLLILSPDYAFGVVYCPGWLLYIALIYSGIGALVAHWVGGHLIVINYAKQKYEANFRYQIVQIRDNSESVALYGSERCEEERLNNSFEWIVRVWWLLMMYTKRLGFFTSFYLQTSVTFPYLVLAPNYFQGQITLGTMFMLFSVLGTVKGSFDWFITSYPMLTSFRATVDRLSNFTRAMEDSSRMRSEVRMLEAPPEESPTAAAAVADLSVRLPGKASRVLWESAGLVVEPGEFVLLSAPEGSGKSCFLRSMAGIWPHATGDVYLPEGALFVPQRSYIPQGQLKQAVAYPERAEAYTDDEVRAALETVGLSVLRTRKLDEDANWAMMLSGGEQQRLAMARVVLRRPRMLLMDEATSALGAPGTLEVYELLRRPGTLPEGAAVITVSHEVQLLSPVHDKHFTYEPSKGVWSQV